MSYILRPYPDVIKAAIGRIVKEEIKKANERRISERRTDMQELEKILEAIEEATRQEDAPIYCGNMEVDGYVRMSVVEEIIRKHMSGKGINVPTNDGWIPVEHELPPNARHEGAFCPKYQVMTKYGVTEGWYNPDAEGWYVLIWFMTDRYLESEIDFDKGDNPKIVFLPDEVNSKQNILTAWKEAEPYHSERSDNYDRE